MGFLKYTSYEIDPARTFDVFEYELMAMGTGFVARPWNLAKLDTKILLYCSDSPFVKSYNFDAQYLSLGRQEV